MLAKLGATLAPLASVSIGFQLRLGELCGRIAALSAGLAFKLVMGPALIMALCTGALGAGGTTIQVTNFEASMAPQIGASIVALEHMLDPPLVTLMVEIGIPLSFLTLPLWWYALQGVCAACMTPRHLGRDWEPDRRLAQTSSGAAKRIA